MIAWLARLGLLLLAGGTVAAALWIPSPWAPLFALALPAAVLGGLATILALEFAYARWAALSLGATAVPLPMQVSAWRGELWATGRLAVWRVPFQSSSWRSSAATPVGGQRGLVLVHGYGCNRAVWAAWLAQLQAQDVLCTAVNLEPIFASISDYAPLIESAMARMQQRTGMAPVVVAHSMGGLAVRAWWAQDSHARRLHRLITVATPHLGTRMARFGHGPAAQQMRPDSEWLTSLLTQTTPAQARRTLCFYSACDNVVIPSGAAVLPGAEARELFGCAHVAMVDHPDCIAAVLRCLRESG